jgi:hypothetical protein
MSEKKNKVLVIGTGHEIQRPQDTMPERQKLRADFEERVRQNVKERKVGLLAEEAGDDEEVWKHLKHEEEIADELAKGLPGELADALDDLFGVGSRTVESPVSTIAKKIAEQSQGKVRHVDIRPPNADELTIEQRDGAMAGKIIATLKDGEDAIVIVGDSHREGVERLLKEAGLAVDSVRFP